ncbi:phosphate/phosphite/phosphonate ABC transporter substrate-binding protein [Tateyamaria sp. SN6-1]|uniref:phosphate/phosphite/phosphonate ABC transporter substrate-binding protein n=1 Tax=Tateyamaria sp. SN6-1 TaxID=3092148 RepID=UPI0039F50156
MIAALGMYDMPHLHAAHDRYWTAIRAALGYGPAALTRDMDPWDAWLSPDLVLAQTCGLPYRARLHGKVQLVCTPDYGLPGCPPGHYNSVLIRRRDDPRSLDALCTHGVMAFNDGLSQSGWAAPLAHLTAHGARPGRVVHTGAHLASVAAVRDGRADFAALDALTHILWAEHDPEAAQAVEVFDHTTPTPVLPYITSLDRDPEPIARAIADAIDTLPHQDRAALHLRGVVQITAEDYLRLPLPPTPAESRIT